MAYAQSLYQPRCARCSHTWRKMIAPCRRASSKLQAGSDDSIGGLTTVYCDDFQCDSSPQVERAIRAFAKDIERSTPGLLKKRSTGVDRATVQLPIERPFSSRPSNWTLTIFAEDVKYQESGVVNVQGKEFYRELVWNQNNVEDYTTRITGMNMSDNAHADIRWNWDGKMGMFGQLSGEVQSTLYLNVLTGRIEEHTDHVTLSGNPLAQIAYKLSKLAWASKLKAKQVGNTVDRALDRMSMDDQEEPYMQDPTDPTRFSQSQDTSFSDGVQWAIFLAIMWTMWQAYSYLGTMGF